MAAEANAPTASEYIVHHLQHLQNVKQGFIVDFSVINIDSIFVSAAIGILMLLVFWSAARKASSGVPGRFQAAVEILVEMVDNQAKANIHNAQSRKFIAPLALTVFVWIFLMNAMDLWPVDLLPVLWQGATGDSHAYLRVVPTADLSTTLGLSSAVLLLCFYYSIKIKGLGGWIHELFTAPFGTSKNPVMAVLLGIVNFAMQIIEFASKTLSHGLRLFGNMYAGELIFMLIALMGGAFALTGTGIGLAIGHVIAGLAWAIFHILIIILQAFIFMMLALVYIGQAHDHH